MPDPVRLQPLPVPRSGPPPFDSPVQEGGYQWWYLDAFDPTSQQALVVIAFVGSVFSPYYFRARHKAGVPAPANPMNFCALNVALYGKNFKRWAMTERCGSMIERDAQRFRLGPSCLEWQTDGSLLIQVQERSAPTGRRISGSIEITPVLTTSLCLPLDSQGFHRWLPWSPLARVKLSFEKPALQWSGEGYMDSNFGSEPLERAFRSWDWSRSRETDGVEIQYAVSCTDGTRSATQVRIDEAGNSSVTPAPECRSLRRTGWGIERSARSGNPVSLLRTLEDTPFYARSLLSLERADGRAIAMHESLSMERFQKTWVRSLLPFRMPRRFWG